MISTSVCICALCCDEFPDCSIRIAFDIGRPESSLHRPGQFIVAQRVLMRHDAGPCEYPPRKELLRSDNALRMTSMLSGRELEEAAMLSMLERPGVVERSPATTRATLYRSWCESIDSTALMRAVTLSSSERRFPKTVQ